MNANLPVRTDSNLDLVWPKPVPDSCVIKQCLTVHANYNAYVSNELMSSCIFRIHYKRLSTDVSGSHHASTYHCRMKVTSCGNKTSDPLTLMSSPYLQYRSFPYITPGALFRKSMLLDRDFLNSAPGLYTENSSTLHSEEWQCLDT